MFKFLGKLFAVTVLIGLVVWGVIAFFPALREKGEATYRKYGGWNEEARQADPVGFIDYAMERLERDISAMETSRLRLREAEQNIEGRLRETRNLEAQAMMLAGNFRTAYRGAEAGAGFPVQVSGQPYTRQALQDQVALILNQHRQYRGLAEELEGALALIQSRRDQLAVQIPEARAALDMLPAKREIARVDELTGNTRELLDQVNAVMNTNQDILEGSPIRTVEQILQAEASTSEESLEAESVIKFLEGDGFGEG